MTTAEKEKRLKEVKEMAEYIKSRFNNVKDIILFGSCAYGSPSNDSDVDMFVVAETKLRPIKQAVQMKQELDKKFGVRFPMDILVRTPEFVNSRKNQDFFIKKIINNGIYL